MKHNRPIVIFSPDPPPDLTRLRLAVQFAAGATVGLLVAALLMPVILPAQPLCERIEARR